MQTTTASNAATPPKWKKIAPQGIVTMIDRALHTAIVINQQTILFWGGISRTQKGYFQRTTERHRGELILFDSNSNEGIIPETYGGEQNIPQAHGARNGHRMIVDAEQVYAYVFGGTPSDGTFRIHLSEMRWERMPAQSNIVELHLAVAAVPGYIYIFGGKLGSLVGTNTFRKLNTKTKQMEVVKCQVLPPKRSSACMEAAYDRFLILTGGAKLHVALQIFGSMIPN